MSLTVPLASGVDEKYKQTLASNIKRSRGELDGALDGQQLDALLAPTGPPTWEVVPSGHGDKHEFYFGSCEHSAVAGCVCFCSPLTDVPLIESHSHSLQLTVSAACCLSLVVTI